MDALLEAQEARGPAGGGDPDAAAEAGLEQALHAERVAAWKLRAGAWLDEQPQGALFTADDLVAAIGKPDTQGRNNAVGAWINAQQNRRRIEFTGRMSKSDRVEGHGNLQRLWRVKDERAGGGVARLGPGGVSSSSTRRVGGGAGSATPPQRRADVSSSPSAVLDEASASGPHSVGVSSSTELPPLTREEEASRISTASAAVGHPAVSSSAPDQGELERAAEDFFASETLQAVDDFSVASADAPGFTDGPGEQLGLLGSSGPAPGAYSEAA